LIQSLANEVGNDPAVIEAHAGAIGIKNASDVGIETMIAMIGHGNGFGEAFGFVVNGARTGRVNMPPIGLLLRMFLGVAVYFGSRGQQEAGIMHPSNA
jgi:hypothetical protein